MPWDQVGKFTLGMNIQIKIIKQNINARDFNVDF